MSRLGLESELMFTPLKAQIDRHDGYTVVSTPNCPDFYDANLLLLDTAPSDAERATLEAAFAEHVGMPPTIQHLHFKWAMQGEPHDFERFISAGYDFAETKVLLAHRGELRPPGAVNGGIAIRPLQSATDWADWRAAQTASNDTYPEPAFGNYLAAMEAVYRQLAEAGRGAFWGAFIDGRQVASLGLFFQADVGRFQLVYTDPAHRGRGICRSLVHHIAQLGLQRVSTLVMHADANYHAARIYEALGFHPAERIGSLCWWPRTAIHERE